MKIVYVTAHYAPNIGGVENVVKWQSAGMARRGHDVAIVTTALQWPHGRLQALPFEVTNDTHVQIRRLAGVQGTNIGGRSVFYPPANIKKLLGLRGVLRELKPDVIHVHHLMPGVVRDADWYRATSKTCQLFFQPYFHPYGRLLAHTVRDSVNRRSVRRATTHGTIVTVNSEEVRQLEHHYGVTVHRSRVIRIPVLWDRAQPATTVPDGPATLLCVARLDEGRKGHAFLLQGLSRITDLDWRIRLVGRGTGYEVTRLAKELGLRDRVQLEGEVTEEALIQLYDSCDVFVMVSQYESYGIPFVEAMFRGKPVVGTKVGGVPEVVGNAGLLVNYGDTRGLADALRCVIVDRELRLSLAQRAYERSFDFESAGLLDTLENLYRNNST